MDANKEFMPCGHKSLKEYFLKMDCPPTLTDHVLDLIDKGEDGFLYAFNNMHGLRIVFDTMPLLIKKGIFEKTLVNAYIDCRVNNRHIQQWAIDFMFRQADREKLIAAGDPLPCDGPFELYRGVSGSGAARRIKGASWTASFDKALWFAKRIPILNNPAVYKILAPIDWILSYTNARDDKHRAIELVLRDKEWSAKSDSWVAKVCLVSNHLVSKMRSDLEISKSNIRETQSGRINDRWAHSPVYH